MSHVFAVSSEVGYEKLATAVEDSGNLLELLTGAEKRFEEFESAMKEFEDEIKSESDEINQKSLHSLSNVCLELKQQTDTALKEWNTQMDKFSWSVDPLMTVLAGTELMGGISQGLRQWTAVLHFRAIRHNISGDSVQFNEQEKLQMEIDRARATSLLHFIRSKHPGTQDNARFLGY